VADASNNPVGLFNIPKDELAKKTNLDLMRMIMKTNFMSKLPLR